MADPCMKCPARVVGSCTDEFGLGGWPPCARRAMRDVVRLQNWLVALANYSHGCIENMTVKGARAEAARIAEQRRAAGRGNG